MNPFKKLLTEDLKEHALSFREDLSYTASVWFKYVKDTWPLFTLLLILFLGAVYFADPPPPKEINFASGVQGGSYEAQALEYQSFFANYGIKVNIIPTSGPKTNLELLTGQLSGPSIDVALTQAGLAQGMPHLDRVLYLGSIDYEPILFLMRNTLKADVNPNVVASFSTLRIGVGEVGTGSLAQFERLLSLDNANPDNPRFKQQSDFESVEQLLKGELDGLVLVDGVQSANVKRLAQSNQVTLLNFPRAQAYSRRLPYLSVLTIPTGSLNLEKNVPTQNIDILSTTTSLIARSDLHPAIQYLLAKAATNINGRATFLADAGTFPKFNDPQITQSEIAREFYLNGSPYLQRYLPFWLAEIVDRLLFIFLPFSALAYPIVVALPTYRKRRLTRKIWNNYTQLKDLEMEITHQFDPQKMPSYLEQIHQIEDQAVGVKISGSLGADYFRHRQHIHFVHALILQKYEQYNSGQVT